MKNNNPIAWKIDPSLSTDPIERFILHSENNTLIYDWYWHHLFTPRTRISTRTTYYIGNESEAPEAIIYMNRGRVYASNDGPAGFGTQFIYPNLAKSIKKLEPHINSFQKVPTSSPWHPHEIDTLEWLASQHDRIARGEVTRADLLHYETEYYVDEPPFKPTEELLKERYELDFVGFLSDNMSSLDQLFFKDNILNPYSIWTVDNIKPKALDYFRKQSPIWISGLIQLHDYDKTRLERGEVSLAQLYNLNPERMKALTEEKDLRELGYLPPVALAPELPKQGLFSRIKSRFH